MLKKITDALLNIETDGSFSTRKTTTIGDLHIEIKNIGALAFPLKSRFVKKIIKQARLAKFGWRDQTRLDKNVRDTWEIPKSKVKIDKRRWNKTLNPMLDQLKQALGISKQESLTAQLHSFLIYEPGQHFLPHQDSEKHDGMVATLVVILPSPHRGGTLIIDHKREQKRYQSSSHAANKLTFFAFYADCRHEVRPVTEGYRVALTYNLILDVPQSAMPCSFSDYTHQSLTQAVGDYFTEKPHSTTELIQKTGVKKSKLLVYLLDHDYTPKGLSWNKLKNVDKYRAQALTRSAKALDLDIYIGLAEIQENWDCQIENDHWGYNGRNRYYWDSNDDDDIVLNELICAETTIRHWKNESGKAVNFQEMSISDNALCWTKATSDFDPFESEYEGYMGNYGNTMDRWYHRAAIILWRKTDHYAVSLEIAPAKTMAEILRLAQNKSTHSKAQQIIRHLLPNWLEQRHEFNDVATFHVVKLGLIIDEPKLARSLLSPLGVDALCPKNAPTLALLKIAYGLQWCKDIMRQWLSPPKQYFEKTDSLIKNLPKIIEKLVANSPAENKSLCDWILNYQLITLKERHTAQKNHSQLAQLRLLAPDRINEIKALLAASIITFDKKTYNNMLRFVMANQILYSVHDLATILQHFRKAHQRAELANWNHPKLLNFVINNLKTEIDSQPRAADDWSIWDKNTCNCADCGTLNLFLQSKDATMKVWPLAKRRRQHIHRIIDAMRLPITHQTKRTGSPQQLVLKKTNKLFTQENTRRIKLNSTLELLNKK